MSFPPTGTVWAATRVHLAIGQRQPPYSLAYVDLDVPTEASPARSPRVLTLCTSPDPPACGVRVEIVETDGELVAERTGDVGHR